MGPFARHRRYWALVLLALLWLPIATAFWAEPERLTFAEGRRAAPWPEFPNGLKAATRLPDAVGQYVDDRLGLRAESLSLQGLLRYALRSPLVPQVAFGRDGWLLYAGGGGIHQSMGILMRENAIDQFARLAEAMARALKPEGGRLIVAIPPNNQTINLAHWPDWAGPPPARTEYDVVMDRLRALGVPAVDLRPALRAANATEAVYYRTDSHWNRLGSLIAFNEVATALGRPEWRWNPAEVYRGVKPRGGGDAARMLGIAGWLEDQEAIVDIGMPAPTDIRRIDEHHSYVAETGHAGPVVLLIGDSFIRDRWRDLLAPRSSRVIWTASNRCAFDWNLVRPFAPDIVILAPIERNLPCSSDAWPEGLPRE